MSFPKHAEYQDSGVEWLGEVPSEWELKRLKYVAALLTDKADERDNAVGLENIEGWTGRFIPTESEFEGAGVDFNTGDILFGKLRPYLAKVWLAEFDGEAVGDFHVLSPAHDVCGRYLVYQMLTRDFISIVDGSTFGAKMPRASWDFMANMVMPVPPLDEQKAISSFLDVETSKIDGLVSEQRRLIELLKEKRQAVISHAVTKGLNPNAPMKPSGIQWLGDVPQHWDVKPVRYACEIHNTLRTPIDRQTRSDIEGDYPYYGPTGILSWINRFVVDGEYFLVGEDGDHFLKFRIQPMTVNIEGKFNVNNHAHLIRGKGNCSTKWASLFFEHKDLMPWLIKQGVGRYKLRKEKLVTIPIVVPPPSEQNDIVEKAICVKKTTTQLQADAERAIELLQERRTALISAAVTGKIDVREFADQETA